MDKENKKGKINISINSLDTVPNDPTIMKGKGIIFNFEKSGNNQVITEDIALENMKTLIGKRICCKYIKVEENLGIDALGSHESYETTNREGEEVVYCNTNAIGFIEDVYIDDYIDSEGNIKRGVIGDLILWCDDHYCDIIGLLQEWLNNGIGINMSCEYLYFNYTVKDNIEYIQSPIIFTAHTLLNSEDRGQAITIEPAYEDSKLLSLNELKNYNKALNSLKSNNNLDLNKKNVNNKEEDNMMENLFLNAMKSNNQLSFGDIRDAIYDKLSEIMTAKEYWNVWISNYGVFDTYFVYETYEDESYINYKVNYTNINDVITIDLEGKEKVTYKCDLVPVTEVESSMNAKKELEKTQKQLVSANNKISTLEGEVKSLNSKMVEKSNNAKEDTEKFNELTEKLVSLNSMVETMKPIVEKYTSEVFEKSLNSAISNYEKTFTGINAMDVFNEDSTQELIKQSINSNKEISEKAIHSLNSLIVNNIKSVKKTDIDEVFLGEANISINELVKAKDNEDLIPKEDDILKEYGLNY